MLDLSPSFLFFLSFCRLALLSFFFFFNDTATTEIYTLSLHDALPICRSPSNGRYPPHRDAQCHRRPDRKSTRLNSSHHSISYAVFCLKKKKKEMWSNALIIPSSEMSDSFRA